MSASVDKDYKVKTELLERSAASKRQLPPIMCSLPSHLNLPPGCEVYVYGSELPADAPLCLCLGEGAPSCCAAGARTLHMPLPRSQGSSGAHVMAGARAVLRELFRRAREQHAKGVYLVGEGIGALFIAKLLADKQLFDECPSAHLLQGAILISGIYDLHDGSALDHIKRVTNQNCISKMNAKQTLSNGSPPQNSLIQNLVDNHQSFVDRNNLSFICDLSNRCTQFDSSFSCNTKKIKPVHGIQLTPEETLKMSPIFQTIAQNEDVNANCKTDRSDNCSVDFDRLSSSMEEIEMMKLLSGEPRDFYPLFEDFIHLRTIAMGVHIIACELDGASITKQSRDMFDRLSNGVDQDDMHFQVKDKVNRSDVRVLLTQNDNFLKRLLRYDIVKYMS